MPQYTITLSDAQDKALRHVALDPQDWIENFTFNRCRIAMEVIIGDEIARLRASGRPVTGTDDEIVMNAPIKSIAQVEAERQAGQQVPTQP
jgi:hypothetical protein